MKDGLIGGGIATVTTGTGLNQILEVIPSDIGKLACLFGILASSGVITHQAVSIWLAVKRAKKLDIEIEKMKKRE